MKAKADREHHAIRLVYKYSKFPTVGVRRVSASVFELENNAFLRFRWLNDALNSDLSRQAAASGQLLHDRRLFFS